MSAPSKTYRVYCFDLPQKAVTADFIKAAHDEDVIAQARSNCCASKCEIWDGKRLVAQLDRTRLNLGERTTALKIESRQTGHR